MSSLRLLSLRSSHSTNNVVGTYLFRRILREGKDSRFDTMRTKPAKLLFAWTAQALWIVLCQSPVTAVNAVGAPVTASPTTGQASSSSVLPDGVLWSDIVGFGLFAFGLVFESVVDWQKASWAAAKHAKQHDEVFMARGLFSLRCVHMCVLCKKVAIS